MNIALEQTEEYVNGQVRLSCDNIHSERPCVFLQLKNKYGDAFIRGNNGMLVLQLASLYSCFLLSVVLYISTVRRR